MTDADDIDNQGMDRHKVARKDEKGGFAVTGYNILFSCGLLHCTRKEKLTDYTIALAFVAVVLKIH